MNLYIEELKRALDHVEIITSNAVNLGYTEGICKLVQVFAEYKKSKKNVYFCGNGGSAGISQHMTADFLKTGYSDTQSI